MLLLPYKLNVDLFRIPFVTVLVCLICVVTFSQQLASSSTYQQRIVHYCSQELDPNLRAILDSAADSDTYGGCVNSFIAIRRASAADRPARIASLAQSARGLTFYPDAQADLDYKTGKLTRGYADFDLSVPEQLTTSLQYNPQQRDFVRMLTSTFAHADLEHLIGNLFFFFVFASCVESALGYLYYVASIVLMAVAASLAYSTSATDAVPTIGLSGVAMGMMALITTLMPRARIWCFFWFLLFFRRFTLPLTVIAVWYLGWNVYDLLSDDGTSRINYMAHVAGGVCGILLGLVFKIMHRRELDAAASEMNY